MSESSPTNGGGAEAVVSRRRGISSIWLIPIVVAVVAVVVAYEAIQERGINVVIIFESAEGLVAGKSSVKYRDVEIGSIEDIEFRDVDHVEVHASIHKGAVPFVTEDATWWVVRPRVSAGGISGLETIVSGSYLTFEPGTEGGKPTREFTGLEEPPIPSRDRPGLVLALHTDHLGGLSTGTRVYFRDIPVGDVIHTALAKDGKAVDVKIVIEQKYGPLVTSTSRFWNAGGVDISIGPGGLDVKTESLASMLAGGVAFDSPAGGEPVKAGDAFWLHRSWADVHKTASSHGGLGLVLEAGSLGSVSPGNPVYYREVPVGQVVSAELSKDGSKVRTRVNIERRYATLVRSNSVFWNASGITADLGLHGLHLHAESLKSLLMGGIAFATPPHPGHTVSEGSVFRLHPEAKKDWLEWETDYTPKDGDPPEKHHLLGKFFHHEDKNEEEAKQEDPTPEPTEEEHKHGFMHRLFHRGD
jgi:paraquat-inducible protein B